MAIVIRPADWVSTQAYSSGARVTYNGVGYEATATITQNVNGNDIPPGSSSWRTFAVFEITDFYSLQEDVILTYNNDDEEVCASVPKFISAAEVILSKFLRSPAQRVTRRFVAADGETFNLPSDIIEIEHLRWDDDGGADRTLRERGSISIQKTNRTQYEEVRQLYEGNRYFGGLTFEYPVYYIDGQVIRIAPIYDANSEFLMTYWQKVPQLGRTSRRVRVVNDVEVAENAAGQILSEFVAAGNNAADFVQGTVFVTTNLWTATTPELLKAATMHEVSKYLKRERDVAFWGEQFKTLAELTVEEFKKFETSGSQSVQQEVAYCG